MGRTDIRKISIGVNYPDGVMHYQVGKKIKLQNTSFEIISIEKRDNFLGLKSSSVYDIYVSDGDGAVLWKTIEDMPVVIENNVNFE